MFKKIFNKIKKWYYLYILHKKYYRKGSCNACGRCCQKIYVKHKDLAVVEHMAEDLATVLRRVFGTRVLGPVAPPVARQQSLHIRKITLKTESSASPSAVSSRLMEIVNYVKSKDVFRSASVVLDVDPL